MIHGGKDLDNLITCLNNELKNITTWLKAYKVSLNAKKNFYKIFHRARLKLPHNHPSLHMYDSTLSETQHFQYISVLLDQKVSWIQHISYVKNQLSKGMGIMYKTQRYFETKRLVNLYHSYIYPYLIYCIKSWGNAPRCIMQILL